MHCVSSANEMRHFLMPKIIPRPGRPSPAWHVPDAWPGSHRSAEHSGQVAQVFGTYRAIARLMLSVMEAGFDLAGAVGAKLFRPL